MKRLLTIDNVCDLLQVSKQTVYRWVHEEFIPHIKLRGILRFDEEAVCKWVDAKRRAGRERRAPEVHIMSRG